MDWLVLQIYILYSLEALYCFFRLQDSWTSFFIPAVLYSVFGRVEHTISVLRLYFCLIIVLFTFLSSHWEKYNTGVLFLPWGYDVSQLVNYHAISSFCSVKTIRSLTQYMI